MRTITLVVPEGACPGDSLSFSVDGDEVDFELPPGSSAGDTLQVSVGAGGEGEAEAECEGEVAGEVEGDADADADADADGEADAEGAAIHSEAWPMGLRMAAVVADGRVAPHLFGAEAGSGAAPLRVLELGSGLGTVGMAAAAALAGLQPAGGSGSGSGSGTVAEAEAEVVLTDLASAVPLLRSRVESGGWTARAGGRIELRAVALEWGQRGSEAGGARYDVILGSDLLYGPEASYPLLVGTIESMLARGSPAGRAGRVVLGTRWRQPAKERTFFELAARRGIDFVLLGDWLAERLPPDLTGDTGCDDLFRGMPSLPWSSYGDMEDQAFAAYLSNTKVSVGGNENAVSLYDLSESDMANMKDDEHSAFEITQMQIYVGRWGSSKRVGSAQKTGLASKRTKIDA